MAPSFGFTRLKALKGVVRVLLTCPIAASDCSGTVELQVAPKPKAKAGAGAAKPVVLGRARYAIARGTHKAVRVRLNKRGRARLRRARHGLRVRVVVRPKGAAPRSKTVRLKGR